MASVTPGSSLDPPLGGGLLQPQGVWPWPGTRGDTGAQIRGHLWPHRADKGQRPRCLCWGQRLVRGRAATSTGHHLHGAPPPRAPAVLHGNSQGTGAGVKLGRRTAGEQWGRGAEVPWSCLQCCWRLSAPAVGSRGRKCTLAVTAPRPLLLPWDPQGHLLVRFPSPLPHTPSVVGSAATGSGGRVAWCGAVGVRGSPRSVCVVLRPAQC